MTDMNLTTVYTIGGAAPTIKANNRINVIRKVKTDKNDRSDG